jgi:hypothetical protein
MFSAISHGNKKGGGSNLGIGGSFRKPKREGTVKYMIHVNKENHNQSIEHEQVQSPTERIINNKLHVTNNEFHTQTQSNFPIATEQRLLMTTEGHNESVSSQKYRRNPTRQDSKFGKINSMIFSDKLKNKRESSNYMNTKESEFLYYQYLYNTFLQCVFSFASICSAVLQYEMEYNDIEGLPHTLPLWFCFITTVFHCVLIVFEYFIYCRILFLNKKLPEKIWRKETKNLVSLILTLIIFFIHPNPIFKGYFIYIYNEKYQMNSAYSINSILTIICLLRMWYFVKFYLVFSDYYSPRTQRVCKMNNFDTSLYFSMKANMIKTPYHAYLLLFVLVLMYCSFCLRIFERVLDEKSGKNFSSYWNSIWCLIITMTTVGYGDYFPSSTLGRMIGIISCICGVFLISMLIVTITNVLNFSGTENNVYLILQRLKLMKDKDDLAAKLIAKYIKMMKKAKHSPMDVIQFTKESLREEILLFMHYYKEKCAEFDSTFPAYSNFDNVVDNLAFLDQSLNTLKSKYDVLEKHIDQIAEKVI